MNKKLFIILIITLFVLALGGGYLTASLISKKQDAAKPLPSYTLSSESNETSEPSVGTETASVTPREQKLTTNNKIERVVEEDVVSDVPKVTWKDGPKRLQSKLAEGVVGYYFQVAGQTNESASIEYKLKSEETGREYVNKSGKFPDVEPSNSGVYVLTLRNLSTGELSAPMEISGFRKINKLSVSELQKILNDVNSPNTNVLVYAYFDVKNLKIHTTGLDEGEIPPASLSAIWAAVAAQGWSVSVKGSPAYDDFNRITEFTIGIE